MKKPSIVTVTLNPAIDLTIQLNQLVPGEVNLARHGDLRPAGKGINVAMVLRDLGEEVYVSGILGLDNRQSYDQLFQERQLSDQFVYEAGSTRINVKLAEADSRVTDVNLPGLTVSPATLAQLLSKLESLCEQADLFVLSGSLPKDLDPAVYGQITTLLKQKGRQVVVDTSGAGLQSAVAAVPFLIKPNTLELAQWAGHALADQAEQEAVIRHLLELGIAHVVLSDGANGVRWYSKNRALQAVPPRVRVISTVGAGDSMVAGLSFGLANNLSMEETLQLATAVSAMAVSQVGVGVTSQDQLQTLKQQVTVKPLPFSL
jgi:1-phosphofructokinase